MQQNNLISRSPENFIVFKRRDILLYGLIFCLWVALLWLITGGYNDEPWLVSWHRWDSLLYQQIFETGYSFKLLGFPPLYPLLIGFISKISFLSFHTAAVIVNILSYFFGSVFLSETLATKFNVTSSRFWLFIFALSAPASYFVFSAYTDTLFFFLLWLLIAITIQEWWKIKPWAQYFYGLLFIILPLVRLTGYAFLSWVLLKRWAAGLVLIPMVVWSYLNYYYTKDIFFFLNAQKLFGMPPGGFFTGLHYSLSYVTHVPVLFSDDWNNWLAISVLPIIFLVAMILTGIWLAFRKQWLLVLTLFSILFISFNQSIWRSEVRYEMPLHGVLGLMLLCISNSTRKKWLRPLFFIVLGLSFLIQFYFAIVFRSNGWAF